MNLSSFDLNHARALHYLLEEAHVARAARRLGITAAAASNALRRLRVELGDELLLRQGRRLVRTVRGEALRQPAREVMLAAERLLTAGSAFDATTYDGQLEVALAEHLAPTLGPRLVVAVGQAAPHATLRLRALTEDLTSMLRRSPSVAVSVQPTTELPSQSLLTEARWCLLRRGHPLLRGPWSQPRLAATPRLDSGPGADPDALMLPSIGWAPAILAATDHVALVPGSYAQYAARTFRLVARRPPRALPPLALSLVWHPRHEADPRHAWLRELVRTETTRASRQTPG